MFTDDISRQLRTKGYDVISVVADPALVGLPDDQILAYATTEGRALATANLGTSSPWTPDTASPTRPTRA